MKAHKSRTTRIHSSSLDPAYFEDYIFRRSLREDAERRVGRGGPFCRVAGTNARFLIGGLVHGQGNTQK